MSYLRSKTTRFLCISVLCSVGVVGSSSAGYASVAPAAPVPSGLPTTFVDEDLPEDAQLLTEMPEDGESLVPAETRAAIVALQTSQEAGNVTQIEWVDEEQALVLYVYGDSEAATNIIEAAAPAQHIEVLPAVRSKDEVDAALQALVDAGGQFGDGLQMYSAVAAPDGSSITVGVDAAAIASSTRSAQSLEILDVPIEIEAAEEPAEARRNRTAAPTMSGGVMTGSGSNCSTGFPIIRVANAERGMLSADHCGSALNVNWQWGTGGSLSVGYTTGQAAGGTDLEVWRGSDQPSTYMLAGSHTNTSAVSIIRGYYTAVSGDQVCYNGAYSSIVCGNTVVNTNVAICYINSFLCYTGLTGTLQNDGISGAGNGDSGGPAGTFVLDPSGTTVSALGAGIISGIGGFPSADGCQGEGGSATRSCSEAVLFAPVANFVNNTNAYQLVATPY